MNCADARELILAGADDDALREHIATCEPCAELAGDGGTLGRRLGQRPALDPAGFDAVASIIKEQDGSPVWKLRSMPTHQRVALAALFVGSSGIVMLIAGRRPDWADYPVMHMGLALGAMFIAAMFGVVQALPREFVAERPQRARIGMFAFLLAIPFLPAILNAGRVAEQTPAADPLATIGGCLGIGTLAALPALLGVRALQRDRKLSFWPTLYAALAAAVGANLALQTHCPVIDPMHVVLGHASLGIVYAVLAWIAVRATV